MSAGSHSELNPNPTLTAGWLAVSLFSLACQVEAFLQGLNTGLSPLQVLNKQHVLKQAKSHYRQWDYEVEKAKRNQIYQQSYVCFY